MKYDRHDSFREREMCEIWKSFDYLLREKLESLDNMTRAMIGEMKTMGVKDDMIATFVPSEFNKVWSEVTVEQCEKYDRKVRGA